jgi:DnaJ-class molecular chaperone
LPFAGVDNNETIKVSRSGGADPDGNQPGDLYVVLKVTGIIFVSIDYVLFCFFCGYFTVRMPFFLKISFLFQL